MSRKKMWEVRAVCSFYQPILGYRHYGDKNLDWERVTGYILRENGDVFHAYNEWVADGMTMGLIELNGEETNVK